MLDILAELIESLIGLTFLAMLIVVVAEVFSRYVLGSSIRGSFEVARYLVVWLCFLGTSQGIRRAQLINITFVKNALSPKWAKSISIATSILMAVFLVIVIRYGAEVIVYVIPQKSPALSISMGIPYMALPVGCTLMLVYLIESLVKTIRGR
jgi:TRAP-type C4-dicarboxylate transport system permease small subunit